MILYHILFFFESFDSRPLALHEMVISCPIQTFMK